MSQDTMRKRTLPLVLLALAIVVEVGSGIIFNYFLPISMIWTIGSAAFLIIYVLQAASKGDGRIFFPLGLGILLINVVLSLIDILLYIFDPTVKSDFTMFFYRNAYSWYNTLFYWPFGYNGFNFFALVVTVLNIIATVGIIILICDWFTGKIEERKIGSILLLGFCAGSIYGIVDIIKFLGTGISFLSALRYFVNSYLSLALIAVAVLIMHRTGLILKYEKKVYSTPEIDEERDIANELRLLRQDYEAGKLSEEQYQKEREELLNKL